MPRREFANVQALQDYSARCDMLYVWENSPKYAERLRQLSPEQYEIVDVRNAHSQRVKRVMVFRKAILMAEWEADAPLRQALGIECARRKNKNSSSA